VSNLEHEVSVNGKRHIIRLPKIDEKAPFSAVIDGKPCQVELLRKPSQDEPFLVKINGKTYRVELNGFRESSPFFVRVNNKPYKVRYEAAKRPAAKLTGQIVEPTLPVSSKRLLSKPIVGKGKAVTAPMPGIVVSLKVKVGDSVSRGQPLCILEAMKMENEITAPKAGVIKEIYVSKGSSVGQGQPMILIE
jgi:biotin carboxyl carrier protein